MSEHELWNELGKLYFNTGAYNEAIGAYRKAIKLDPGFGWPYSNLALTFFHKGNYAEAISLYRRSIDLFTNKRAKAITWNRLGDIYRQLKDYDRAIAAYQRADELDLEKSSLSDGFEDDRVTLGDPRIVDSVNVANDEAILPVGGKTAPETATSPTMEDIFSREDENVLANQSPAVMEPAHETFPGCQGEDCEKAMADFKSRFETSNARDVLFGLEDRAVVQNQPLNQPEEFRQAFSVAEGINANGKFAENPTNGKCVNDPLQAVEQPPQSGEPFRADVGDERALSVPPVPEPENFILVESADSSSIAISMRTAEPHPGSERGESINPVHLEAGLTFTHSAEDMHREANGREGNDPGSVTAEKDSQENTQENIAVLSRRIVDAKRVLEMNPNNAFGWSILGNLLKSAGRYGEAISAYEQAISIDPTKAFYFYHLGLVYAAQKRYDDAVNSFHKVVELDPGDSLAHASLAGYYRKLGQEAEAQKHLRHASSTIQSESEYNLACFEAICGNIDQAIELLRISVEKKQISLDWVRRDPDLDFVRDDPRYKALVGDQ